MTRFYLLVLFIIVLGIPGGLVSGQCRGDQKALLLDLKGSLELEELKEFRYFKPSKLVTWHSSRDCCDWEGVSCDPDGLGHVIGLDLSEEWISGWTPSGIFSLPRHLQSLNLAFNNFQTTIPGGLASLTELVYLNLSNAGFVGQVPVQLSLMAKLVTLDLSFSYLYGEVSSLILEKPNLASLVRSLSNLREFYLDGISLSRDGKDWCHALSSSVPNLQVLSLSHCNLSSRIDASLENLKFLSTLNLRGNNLYGQIPDTILQIPSLETIDLSNNTLLNVSFPEFHQYQSLRNLLLSRTTILGALPQSIGYLKNLSRVELAFCNLKGIIPGSVRNLTQLVSLDLSFNKLTGVVPSFNMSRNLTYLDLSGNQLSGEIPSEGFSKMRELHLSYNQFSGNIPPSLFEIPSLKIIRLSFNQLGGQIPEFPSASASLLNSLELGGNNLTGHIPSSIFDLSRLNILSLSSNRLNGLIQLDWVRKLVNLVDLDLSHNSLTVEVASNESNLTSFQQFNTLGLASCNLSKFPDLGKQSTLASLDLSNNNIPEVLPWLEKFAKRSLFSLNLSCNLLKSLPEPKIFYYLNTLDVHGNQLHGKFPLLPLSITYVDYSSNKFNSSIPLEIGQSKYSVIFFSLANNSLSGGIPESICNFFNLEVLDLSNNHLNGMIPACLIGRNANLGVLDLRGNRLSGIIPDNFQVGCGLQTLDVSRNVLQGKVPGTLANCTNLEVLDLGNNQINDTFPCALRNHLSNLRVLILRNNRFHGQISCPDIPANWEMLQIMDLSQNQFNGVLPEEALLSWKAMMGGGYESHDSLKFVELKLSNLYYQDSVTVTGKGVQLELVKIQAYFTAIDFSCNQLEGPLPEAIGNFSALYLLNLSHNSFSGPILQSIGNLAQLESLDLSANNFSGAIPEQLAILSFLSFLDVSDNKLTGTIPTSTQIQSFPASSFEDNPGLCGLPLPRSCHHTDESMVPPGSSIEKSEKDWQFILAAGLGFMMGGAAVFAPLIYDKTFNRWCDYQAHRIHMMLVSYFDRV